jgi:hypothetical protein
MMNLPKDQEAQEYRIRVEEEVSKRERSSPAKEYVPPQCNKRKVEAVSPFKPAPQKMSTISHSRFFIQTKEVLLIIDASSTS